MTAIIEVEGLTKSYGSKRGITNVSFQVEEGEVFGFLGPNGAGKTTTIRLLMALLRADAGTARIAGLDCWEQSVAIKRLVGYLPGEPSLGPQPDWRPDSGILRASARRRRSSLSQATDQATWTWIPAASFASIPVATSARWC